VTPTLIEVRLRAYDGLEGLTKKYKPGLWD
jgi:hypothetical protein